MPTLHQYDYIFAIGTIFALLDAYMIGANDVANSWSTSVSSKTFTLRQACLFAAVFEFLGAVTAGARVTGTIKNGIVPGGIFPIAGMQMLGFSVAIFCSSMWLTLATYMSWPVSTTYSIISAIVGVGIAYAIFALVIFLIQDSVGGFDAPTWGWNDSKGLAAIWAGLVIAPGLAAAFGAACFLLVKFLVLRSKQPIRRGMILGPFFFFLVTSVCTMLIVYKGAPELGLAKMSSGKTAAAIVLTGTVVAILSILFWVPFVYSKIVKQDYTLRWYHFFFGPLLWKRQAPADAPEIQAHVADYRIRKERKEESAAPSERGSHEKDPESIDIPEAVTNKTEAKLSDVEGIPKIEGFVLAPRNIWIFLRYRVFGILTYGTSVDVHKIQLATGTSGESRMDSIMARATQYPNEVEHLFSFLQVITACTASFAHGSNDLSNAIGPFSVIYHTWKTGELSGKNSDVETWQLVMGASALVIGLASYGYNIMAVLGNRLTLISPSRGFCMELGAALTVILASQYGIPVSTTMCIVGATIGVGLANFNLHAVNWKQIAHIYVGWIGTIVIVAVFSACVMAIIINAPRL